MSRPVTDVVGAILASMGKTAAKGATQSQPGERKAVKKDKCSSKEGKESGKTASAPAEKPQSASRDSDGPAREVGHASRENINKQNGDDHVLASPDQHKHDKRDTAADRSQSRSDNSGKEKHKTSSSRSSSKCSSGHSSGSDFAEMKTQMDSLTSMMLEFIPVVKELKAAYDEARAAEEEDVDESAGVIDVNRDDWSNDEDLSPSTSDVDKGQKRAAEDNLSEGEIEDEPKQAKKKCTREDYLKNLGKGLASKEECGPDIQIGRAHV